MISPLFDVTLIITILLCALVAGLVFGFATVVMPGIATLPDREFLRAFQRMDGSIQNRQPMFMLVWLGSIVSALLCLILGIIQLNGIERYLMCFGTGLYLLAVQGPTLRFNIPLNNAVQSLKIESMSEAELAQARTQFEAPWNRWNRFRTLTAVLSVIALLTLQWSMGH